MKFAFLVHPLGNDTDRMLAYLREVDLQRSFGWDMAAFFHDTHRAIERSEASEPRPGEGRVEVIDELPGLVSELGARADGRLYQIPLDSFAMLENPELALEHMEEAVRQAADWGARLVGLGAMTGVVGSGGAYLAERSPLAVTTGNSLTVYAAVTNLEHACRDVHLRLADETVTVVGVPGSIAAAAARLLRPRCGAMRLIARQPSGRATALAEELGAELGYDLPDGLARSRIVVSATSSGGCIEPRWLARGTILSDVGVPTDVLAGGLERDDVLILSGGLCMVPKCMPLTSHYLWFHRGSMAACLAETLVLALDETPEPLSLGRGLSPDRIARIGERAEAHGFHFRRLFSFGQPLADSALTAYRKRLARAGAASGVGVAEDAPTSVAALGAHAVERYRRHVNPALVAVAGSLVRPFVRGEGCRVWDAAGKCYLDFLAGYGSLNLGHNHPGVVAGVQAALAEQAPGFSPAAINPLAAALAEELAAVSPPGLEIAFFANSGAEAVEAALKLARRATGRTGLLYCERSYHGKTLGALSVTGNGAYQRPFAPLVPDCEAVPFGDAAALERALLTRRFAAFVVEPVQAEGGMIVPPDDYLARAQRLCRDVGTLLVADEVQTGLGRTGRLFAVDRSGVEPDVLVLAKSLGGGLVPLGAMLSRRATWTKAYGSLESFALHTSTFGGGSLACAAGLATLRALRDGQVVANAEARGEQLLAGLRRLADRYPLIREVRGVGLLIGVEFEPPAPSTVTLWEGLLGSSSTPFLVPGLGDVLDSLTATYVMALLLEEHGIYTQVARSRPRVLRIEPPLILGEDEAARFLEALDRCCHEVTASYAVTEQMVTKAILGRHGAEPAQDS